MNIDIVTRLRGAASESYGCQCVKCEAAAEIERLQRRLLAAENAYDIERRQNEHLQTDRNNLALEVERLRAERDEVRQSYCSLMEAYRGGDGRVTANKLGWDCFKEAQP